ncbi:NfrA family protein [Shigella flexneri]
MYLDAAQCTARILGVDGGFSRHWHRKVANGQALEPYAHVQDNGYRDKGTQGAQLGGVGVRWILDRRDALRRLAAQSQSGVSINIP